MDVRTEDLFEVSLANATVVFMFLLPEINARLRSVLQAAPSLRVALSHTFEVCGWPCGRRLRVGDSGRA